MEENGIYKIERLHEAEWKGYSILFSYETAGHYELQLQTEPGALFSAMFIKKEFPAPIRKTFKEKLFEPWWTDARAYGVVENGELLAVVQSAVETWSNRLRVTELWVREDLRRQGLGVRLMQKVKDRAVKEKRRAIILETQSCNLKAIAFYTAQGFCFAGFSACDYSNKDIEAQEVRMELVYYCD